MNSTWPDGRPQMSLWDMACRMTGQNATEEKPTNQTRDALARLAPAVYEGKLWVHWARGLGVTFILRFLPE